MERGAFGAIDGKSDRLQVVDVGYLVGGAG
jgi:hypothetical protein